MLPLAPGIGKALAKRLADQGLNVVLVALPDDMLDTTHEQLVADYPGVQFRKVRLAASSAAGCWRTPGAATRTDWSNGGSRSSTNHTAQLAVD